MTLLSFARVHRTLSPLVRTLRFCSYAMILFGLSATTIFAQQSFVIDDFDQRVSHEWISNSMQQFGSDEVASFAPGSFSEALVDGAVDPDYDLTVAASQGSTIQASNFTASGAASFLFAAGEFAQGSHADLESRSFFYLYFEPETAGTLHISGILSVEGNASVELRVESLEASIDQVLTGGQGFDLAFPIAPTQFVSIQLTASTDFFVDDPFFFDTVASGAAEFIVEGMLTLAPPVRRGDCNADAAVDVADAVRALEDLFIGGEPLLCPAACDANDDGGFDISDAVAILAALFVPGNPLPAPYPGCGIDPTPTSLACPSFDGCP
ncbi:MAG: hypothetical protein AAF488_02740 [Planctomycetota bacterium]